ncbi:MAG: hypothetical protein A2231_11210 [Candidatus Firestonebacteria bacterium RIFOXYA2_FULL_40_8]|nr:MAG: hypothetical protein A2328_01385 [Bdellovibrionales bacterium RIFOXYB2_FULL_36_6]OGF45291.1 MAG: hypothetical protein A2231_11210 [Candidatus Firestonebacteria bacterium RIFOXYA2_FULL_40_8]
MRKKLLIAAAILSAAAIIAWLFIPKKTEPVAVVEEKPVVVAKPLLTGLFVEHIFNVKEKKDGYKNTVNIYKKDNLYFFKSVITKKGQKDITAEAKLNKDFETIEWKCNNPKKNIQVSALRKGNKIILTGTFDKKENNKKEINIDARKWQQVYQLGLMKFAVKEPVGKSIEFWSLNPDEPQNAMVLAAVKESRELIDLHGKKVGAARLKICLAGFLSVFWTGDYWFRLSDGFFVRGKISGDIFVELQEEKLIKRK